jgi:hypothetical protein
MRLAKVPQRLQQSRGRVVRINHVSIAEVLDGKVVDWLEHDVSDAQYRA